MDPSTEIDGVSVASLIAEHGSPLFVYSERTIRDEFRRAMNAFQQRYARVQFAWSYKTCYLRAICAIFHQEGSIAEVTSDFEYEKARRMGMPGRSILFNGPWKPPAILARAVNDGATIQVEHLDELSALARIAEGRPDPVAIGLRVRMYTQAHSNWTRFGFDVETGEVQEAGLRVAGCKQLRITGLHTHLGTRITDPERYRTATERLLDVVDRLRSEHGVEIEYLNLGGGFVSGTSWDEYAEAITEPIRRRWPTGRELPKLFLESGRALIEDAGYHICRIVARKNDGYIVDSGTHLLLTSDLFPWSASPAQTRTGLIREATLYGSLCMNSDVLRRDALLPEMEPGDALVIHPVGAYHLTQSMQFIQYRPRVVLIDRQGQVHVIRERESLEHIEALEQMPAASS